MASRLVLAWLTMAVSLANDLLPGVKRMLLSSINRNILTVFSALQSLKRACFMFSAPVSLSTTALHAANSLNSYR